MMKKRQSQIVKFFSLIELIIVVAIAGLLLAIAAPSLTKLFSVQGAKSAAITVKLTLETARSMAINKNVPVAVVFLQDEIDSERGKELAYRAVRVCEVEKTATAGTYDFKKWLDNWSELEAGNLLVKVKDKATVIPFEVGTALFKAAMHNDGTNVKMFDPVVEIVKFTSTTEPFKTFDPNTPTVMPSGNTLCAVVFTPQGRTSNNLVFFIAQANYVGDIIINRDKAAGSYGEFLYINKFTGRTKYGEIE